MEPYKGSEPYIFVSYSHKDKSKILPIVAQMSQDGYRIWYDEGICPASEYSLEIETRIINCSVFIAFISKDFWESGYCKDELTCARDLLDGKKTNKSSSLSSILLIKMDKSELPIGFNMRFSRIQHITLSDSDFYPKLYRAENISCCQASDVQSHTQNRKASAGNVRKKPYKSKNSAIAAVVAVVAVLVFAAVISRNAVDMLLYTPASMDNSTDRGSAITDDSIAKSEPDTRQVEGTDNETPGGDSNSIDSSHVESGGKISDSWGVIFQSVEDGTYKSKYQIGDTKELDLGSEGIIHMQIAAFDTDKLSDGSGTAAITWISQELLTTKYAMNTSGSSSGGWETCELRQYLQDTVFPLIPSEVGIQIQSVQKTSIYKDNQLSTEDKLWIPSCDEVYGSNAVYHDLFNSNDNRVKNVVKQSVPSSWWLRCAHNYSNFDLIKSEGGKSSSKASDTYGIALGFCI